MQQTSDDALMVHAQLRQNARHFQRVSHKGLSTFAHLVAVRVYGQAQRLLDLVALMGQQVVQQRPQTIPEKGLVYLSGLEPLVTLHSASLASFTGP